MSGPEVEYCPTANVIEKALRSIDRPGDYCVHGRLLAYMPGLEVDAVGTIAFPVQEAQLDRLVQAAEQAPYGHGPETVFDSSVRNCLQIDPARIRLHGKGWHETFGSILTRAANGIGCPADRLEAELYKLLIYQKDGFFAAHRDTEKQNGMVATLVISLPVEGEGGELVVRHGKRESVFDMTVLEPSELAYAAFYADCEHETKPVREGHRIALVYNLILRADGGAAVSGQAPDHSTQVETVASWLGNWNGGNKDLNKLVWLLDHDYSPAGLAFSALKGRDAAVARTLAEAAKEADCSLYAAIIHIDESGEALDKSGYMWYSEYGEPPPTPGEIKMGEVYDGDYWLDEWVAGDDTRPGFGKIPLLDGELLPRRGLDKAKPDSQRIIEVTGNAGVTMARTYRHAALAIWPNAKAIKNLASHDIVAAIDFVAAKIEADGQETQADGKFAGLVSQVIDAWPKNVGRGKAAANRHRKMLGLLSAVANETETLRFLNNVLARAYTGLENEELAALTAGLRPETLRDNLPGFVGRAFRRHPAETLELVDGLWAKRTEAQDPEARGLFQKCMRNAYQGLAQALQPRAEQNAWGRLVRPKFVSLSPEGVRDLFALGWRLGLHRETEAAADLVVDLPQAVSPDRALPEALLALRSSDGDFSAAPSFAALWGYAAEFLLARSSVPPQEPTDWAIPAKIECTCDVCKDLKTFCDDPIATTKKFKLRQELRDHLCHKIEEYGLDLDYKVVKSGRPFSVDCTKNRATHKRRLKEYGLDLDHMRKLAEAAPSGEYADAHAHDLERLHGAIAFKR